MGGCPLADMGCECGVMFEQGMQPLAAQRAAQRLPPRDNPGAGAPTSGSTDTQG